MKEISELTKSKISKLKAADEVLFSGRLYTARDQAHKKIADLIKSKKKLPLDLKNKIIYYCGPTLTPKGRVIGSCGPTTSLRMDSYTSYLIKAGVIGLVGKGRRTKQIRELLRKNSLVYFIAPAGCGAYLSEKVTTSKVIAFKELGPEAIYELEVKDFPLVVAIDSKGKSIYQDYDKDNK